VPKKFHLCNDVLQAKRQLEVAKMEQEDKRAAAIRAEKLAIRRQRIHLEIQMMTAQARQTLQNKTVQFFSNAGSFNFFLLFRCFQDKLSKALSRADTLWRDEQKRRAEAEERRKKRMVCVIFSVFSYQVLTQMFDV
jgi:hypothetical protein